MTRKVGAILSKRLKAARFLLRFVKMSLRAFPLKS